MCAAVASLPDTWALHIRGLLLKDSGSGLSEGASGSVGAIALYGGRARALEDAGDVVETLYFMRANAEGEVRGKLIETSRPVTLI